MKNILLILTCMMLVVIACRKRYPEDGRYTLKSSFKRLTDKEWVIYKAEINGLDSTEYYLKNVIIENKILFNSEVWKCDKTGKGYVFQSSYKPDTSFIAIYPYCECTHTPISRNGNPWFSDNNVIAMNVYLVYPLTKLYGFNDPNSGQYKRYQCEQLNYTIEKLTNSKNGNELILSINYRNKEFKIYFKS
jgi:hypothetical protein